MSGAFRLHADGIYRCEEFQQFTWQEHGFGTIAANPPVNVTLRQIHSNLVFEAAGLEDRICEGDGLITSKIDQTIGIRTADCVPLLVLDAKHRAVGAVHAGWRGSASGIVVRALEQLRARFHTKPIDVHVAIGPCIRPCCYEVGPDVAAHFAELFPEWGDRGGKRCLDLAEANRRQLQSVGVPPDQIFDCGFCTHLDAKHFFSYRREPDNPGRLISAIRRTE